MPSDLDSFAERVRNFRKSRTTPRQPFPTEMRVEAIALKNKYGSGLMEKICGISSGIYVAWEGKLRVQSRQESISKNRKMEASSQQTLPSHTRISLKDFALPLNEEKQKVEAKSKSECVMFVKNIRIEIFDAGFLASVLNELQKEMVGKA